MNEEEECSDDSDDQVSKVGLMGDIAQFEEQSSLENSRSQDQLASHLAVK